MTSKIDVTSKLKKKTHLFPPCKQNLKLIQPKLPITLHFLSILAFDIEIQTHWAIFNKSIAINSCGERAFIKRREFCAQGNLHGGA